MIPLHRSRMEYTAAVCARPVSLEIEISPGVFRALLLVVRDTPSSVAAVVLSGVFALACLAPRLIVPAPPVEGGQRLFPIASSATLQHPRRSYRPALIEDAYLQGFFTEL
jgi:hypothetical protein